MHNKIIVLLFFMLIPLSLALGEVVKSGDNSVIVNEVNGNVSITYLNLQEEILRKEIERIVDEIRSRGDAETKKLVDTLQDLRKRLSEVVEEKNQLAKMVYVYRSTLDSLTSSRNYENSKQNEAPTLKSDISKIESSLESLEALSNEIKKEKDEHRMLLLLDILIHDTDSMAEDERNYWKDIFSIMTFNQRFRLFEILSTERFKLAEMERKYSNEIKILNNQHQKKWLDLKIKEAKKNNDQKALRLLAAKEISLVEPSVQDLRQAEQMLNKLIVDEPRFLEAYLYLIDVLNKYNEDRSYDAKVIMEKAKSQFPDSGEFYKELGYIYLRLGDKTKAYPSLRDASMMIDDGKLHRIFSSLAVEKGEVLLAKSIMDKSYHKNKEDAEFVSAYSYVLEITGKSEQAISVLTDLIGKNKKVDILYSSLGWRHYQNKRYPEAKSNFSEAARINIKNYGALLMAALSNIESHGDIKESIKLTEDCLNSFTYAGNINKEDEGEIYLALSILYSETKVYNKVVEYSTIAVKNTFGCSENYMKEKRNWRDKALALLQKHRLGIGCP